MSEEYDLSNTVTDLLLRNLIKNQALGITKTFCEECGKERTFKMTDSNGTFTWKCGCGCSVYRYKKDRKCYLVKHYRNEFERNGFKKKEGKYVK